MMIAQYLLDLSEIFYKDYVTTDAKGFFCLYLSYYYITIIISLLNFKKFNYSRWLFLGKSNNQSFPMEEN